MTPTKDTLTAAILKLEKLNEEISTRKRWIAEHDLPDARKVAPYIIEGWAIELALWIQAKETLENWIIEHDFDI